MRLGSQSQAVVGSYFSVSFLRGPLTNHGTPPAPQLPGRIQFAPKVYWVDGWSAVKTVANFVDSRRKLRGNRVRGEILGTLRFLKPDLLDRYP